MRINALMTGCVAAFLAVVAQAFFAFSPPAAYGICIVCHGKDLLNWLINHMFFQRLPLNLISLKIPILTVIGILLGAFIASYKNKEWKKQWVENKIVAFFTGMLVMISGLIISACPIRLLLRTAYGDFIALGATVALIIGIIAGTQFLKWRAKKL